MPARARDLGLHFSGTTGRYNAITDVPGLTVGYSTLTEGDHIQTGVTAIHPRGADASLAYLWAGQHTLNGNGEMTGCQWIHDAGYFAGPVCITNTHAVGMAHHATVKWMIQQYPDFFQSRHQFVMPVIAETYDGILSDINGLHLKETHVFEALNTAGSGAIAEGNVGGGNGMITYEFAAGTGSASRTVACDQQDYTLGVLVQSNFGHRNDLSILGVPVGQHLTNDILHEKVQQVEQGSIIVIIATDAPLIPSQLTRIAKRATLGLARTGTIGGHSSGDIYLAFTTANARETNAQSAATINMAVLDDYYLDVFYRAARDAVEESIINALVAGQSSVAYRPKGLAVKAMDCEAMMALIERYGRSVL
ncbi:P1 family peptidase [SAR92 clade bacterium H231]|nr:P1 family peptidase [SAR92 clade bacterium H231]